MRTFAANQSKYPYNQEDDNRQKQKDRQIDHQKDQQVFKEDLDSVQSVGKSVGNALGDGGGAVSYTHLNSQYGSGKICPKKSDFSEEFFGHILPDPYCELKLSLIHIYCRI